MMPHKHEVHHQKSSGFETIGKVVVWIAVIFFVLWLIGNYSSSDNSNNSLQISSSNSNNSQPENSIEKAKQSIVWVKYEVEGKDKLGTHYSDMGGSGSGVIISQEGSSFKVLTNRHVVDCDFSDVHCFQRIKEKVRIFLQSNPGDLNESFRGYCAHKIKFCEFKVNIIDADSCFYRGEIKPHFKFLSLFKSHGRCNSLTVKESFFVSGYHIFNIWFKLKLKLSILSI